MLYKSLKGILFIVCAILVQRFCHLQTDGFALYKIFSSLTPRAEWEIPSPAEEEMATILHILDQPFFYLGKGAQCYVFASEDERYVLKFFRHDHTELPFWSLYFPEWKCSKKRAKRMKDFMSFRIAYDTFREESGILFLQLNKNPALQKQIILFDKIGVRHQISIDQVEFVLQKRAELLYPTLEHWIVQGDKAQAAKTLSDLVQLLALRCKKGIHDKDPDLNTNFGVIAGKPIQIDVGRFTYDKRCAKPEVYQPEILRITDNLKQWLDLHAPDLASHLLQEIEGLSPHATNR